MSVSNFQVAVAVSVEALVFIVIIAAVRKVVGSTPTADRAFNYRPIMHGAVGSFVSNEVLGPSTYVKLNSQSSLWI